LGAQGGRRERGGVENRTGAEEAHGGPSEKKMKKGTEKMAISAPIRRRTKTKNDAKQPTLRRGDPAGREVCLLAILEW
jgi:hypothetical protein